MNTNTSKPEISPSTKSASTTEPVPASPSEKNTGLKRGIYILPNLLTIGSLFAGFYAIVAALKGSYDHAAISIFIAMLMDGLDGRVARLTNTVTSFGAELDSITDMVSFGVAPALVIYSWALENLGKIGWLCAFVYVAAGALRLARFNTQLGNSDKRYFQGLSITASAGVIASVIWLGRDLEIPPHSINILLAALTVIIGALMVSNIRYHSFKGIDFKKHVPFIVILAIASILIVISFAPAKILFAIFFLYACSGPILTIWGLRQRKKARKLKGVKT
jgi:CDP-diacylglycerol---serine O-phosphatidyltransferase